MPEGRKIWGNQTTHDFIISQTKEQGISRKRPSRMENSVWVSTISHQLFAQKVCWRQPPEVCGRANIHFYSAWLHLKSSLSLSHVPIYFIKPENRRDPETRSGTWRREEWGGGFMLARLCPHPWCWCKRCFVYFLRVCIALWLCMPRFAHEYYFSFRSQSPTLKQPSCPTYYITA